MENHPNTNNERHLGHAAIDTILGGALLAGAGVVLNITENNVMHPLESMSQAAVDAQALFCLAATAVLVYGAFRAFRQAWHELHGQQAADHS